MGTNYYARSKICKECGRHDELHIGKSSGGWKFHFRGYRDSWEDVDIRSKKEWEEYLKDKHIFNEYDEEVSYEDFFNLVELKQKDLQGNDETDKDGYNFTFCEFC